MTTAATKVRAGPLIDFLGRTWTVDSPVSATVFNGSTSAVAFALGNGDLALARCDADDIPGAHSQVNSDGAIEVTPSDRPADPLMRVLASARPDLSVAADIQDGFLGGDQDGDLFSIEQDGQINKLASFGATPIRCVATTRPGGLRACAVGHEVYLYGAGFGGALTSFKLEHPAAALAFDSKGTRLAAAHEGGLTLWPTGRSRSAPRTLPWPGRHRTIAWSPDNRFIASSMAENALHAWRLRDGAEFDMPGLAATPTCPAWARRSRFLVSDGDTRIACWPIAGADRTKRLRAEKLGIPSEILVTSVACHPQNDTIAAGYANGALLLCRYNKGGEVFVKGPGDGAVKAVAWSADGRHLALATEQGFVAVVSFPAGFFK